MTDRLMEEVQDVLGHTPPRTPERGPREVSEMSDPATRARHLLNTYGVLIKKLQDKLDTVNSAFGAAKKSADRLDKIAGSGTVEAASFLGGEPVKALGELGAQVNFSLQQLRKVVADASRGRGSLGFRENQETYLDHLDARLEALDYDSPTDNVHFNDISADLVAAAENAANYLSTPSQLQIGSTVHIGRKKLSVVGQPKMVNQGYLLHLVAPDNMVSFVQPGDAYELMVPIAPDNSTPPAMGASQMQVKPTAEAVLTHNGRSVKILAADLRLTEGDYGDHMYAYNDYGPAMGKIKVGDRVAGLAGIGPTATLQVIGKSGDSAVMMPSTMDMEMYGRFRSAAQYSRTPVGQGTPSVPKTNLWQPGMARIPAGSDFAGRGGKSVQDTHNVPLSGARVVTFNPHSGKYTMASGLKPGQYDMADTIQIVGHDPSLPTAVGEEVTPERFELLFSEAPGDTTIDKLRFVMEHGTYAVNGILVEPAVAAVMLQFHGTVAEGNRERMEAMSVHDMLQVSQKMLVALESHGSVDEAKGGGGLPSLDDLNLDDLMKGASGKQLKKPYRKVMKPKKDFHLKLDPRSQDPSNNLYGNKYGDWFAGQAIDSETGDLPGDRGLWYVYYLPGKKVVASFAASGDANTMAGVLGTVGADEKVGFRWRRMMKKGPYGPTINRMKVKTEEDFERVCVAVEMLAEMVELAEGKKSAAQYEIYSVVDLLDTWHTKFKTSAESAIQGLGFDGAKKFRELMQKGGRNVAKQDVIVSKKDATWLKKTLTAFHKAVGQHGGDPQKIAAEKEAIKEALDELKYEMKNAVQATESITFRTEASAEKAVEVLEGLYDDVDCYVDGATLHLSLDEEGLEELVDALAEARVSIVEKTFVLRKKSKNKGFFPPEKFAKGKEAKPEKGQDQQQQA